MSFRKALPFALTAMLTLSACGGDGDDNDDPTGPSGDTPTSAEVSGMLSAMSTLLSAAFAGGPPVTGIAAQQTLNYSHTGNCPNGGTTGVTGTYTVASGTTTSLHYTVTQTYNNCKANGNGAVYTFNGEGLTLTYDYTLNQTTQALTYAFHETGNLNWASPSKGGTCAVNISLNYQTGSGTPVIAYSGTFCGVNIAG